MALIEDAVDRRMVHEGLIIYVIEEQDINQGITRYLFFILKAEIHKQIFMLNQILKITFCNISTL